MGAMDSGSGSLGARCALHPTMGASGTCERCGNFMCSVCGERGTHTLCPSCRERTRHGAFPLRRDTWSFGALWNYCLEAFKRDWLMLSLAALVWTAVHASVELFSNLLGPLAQRVDSWAVLFVIAFVVGLVQSAVQGVVGMGMLRVVFDVLEGGRADLGRLFSQVGKAGRYVGAVLLGLLVVGLPLVLLFGVLSFVGLVAGGVPLGDMAGGAVFESEEWQMLLLGVFIGAFLVTLIPGLYFGLPFFLLKAELAYNDDVSAVQALRNCFALARGERLSILGMVFVVFLVTMVGLVACCVGVIPTLALGQTLVGGLYLSLRNGSEA